MKLLVMPGTRCPPACGRKSNLAEPRRLTRGVFLHQLIMVIWTWIMEPFVYTVINKEWSHRGFPSNYVPCSHPIHINMIVGLLPPNRIHYLLLLSQTVCLRTTTLTTRLQVPWHTLTSVTGSVALCVQHSNQWITIFTVDVEVQDTGW